MYLMRKSQSRASKFRLLAELQMNRHPNTFRSQAMWHRTVIPATWEAKARGRQVKGSPLGNLEKPCCKIKLKRLWIQLSGVPLGSILSTIKSKERKNIYRNYQMTDNLIRPSDIEILNIEMKLSSIFKKYQLLILNDL